MKLNTRLKIGIPILIILALGSFVLPFFNTVDPSQQGTYLKNMPVTADHLLGTNSQGQDIFWFLVYAVRNSLILGIAVSIFTTFIATFIGLSAGYIGGWYDRLVMTITD
jgi:peptide/nickel transport system permease protein